MKVLTSGNMEKILKVKNISVKNVTIYGENTMLNNIPHYDLMMWTFMLICILVIIQLLKLYLMIRKDFNINITKKIELPKINTKKTEKKDKGVAS